MRASAKRGRVSPANFPSRVNDERCPGRYAFDRVVPLRYGTTFARRGCGADSAGHSGKLYISAITLIEVNYLSGKKSFPYSGVFPRLIALAADPSERLEVIPVTLEIFQAIDLVPRLEVPDMPDARSSPAPR